MIKSLGLICLIGIFEIRGPYENLELEYVEDLVCVRNTSFCVTVETATEENCERGLADGRVLVDAWGSDCTDARAEGERASDAANEKKITSLQASLRHVNSRMSDTLKELEITEELHFDCVTDRDRLNISLALNQTSLHRCELSTVPELERSFNDTKQRLTTCEKLSQVLDSKISDLKSTVEVLNDEASLASMKCVNTSEQAYSAYAKAANESLRLCRDASRGKDRLLADVHEELGELKNRRYKLEFDVQNVTSLYKYCEEAVSLLQDSKDKLLTRKCPSPSTTVSSCPPPLPCPACPIPETTSVAPIFEMATCPPCPATPTPPPPSSCPPCRSCSLPVVTESLPETLEVLDAQWPSLNSNRMKTSLYADFMDDVATKEIYKEGPDDSISIQSEKEVELVTYQPSTKTDSIKTEEGNEVKIEDSVSETTPLVERAVIPSSNPDCSTKDERELDSLFEFMNQGSWVFMSIAFFGYVSCGICILCLCHKSRQMQLLHDSYSVSVTMISKIQGVSTETVDESIARETRSLRSRIPFKTRIMAQRILLMRSLEHPVARADALPGKLKRQNSLPALAEPHEITLTPFFRPCKCKASRKKGGSSELQELPARGVECIELESVGGGGEVQDGAIEGEDQQQES